MATYKITDMRVVRPSPKMAEKHPDRFLTIFGNFATDNGTPLSITSKVITKEDAQSGDFSIDIDKGILTLTDGQKGRKSFASLSQADINAELEALKPTE